MEFAAGTLRNALRSEQLAFVVLDFDVVVGQHAVNVAAVIDGGDHGLFFRFLNSNFVLFLPLTKFFCQSHHLLYQLFQLQGFLRKFVEESQRFLLPVNGVNGLYALVIIHTNRPELGVKLGQPDVEIVGILVFRDDCKISTEYSCPDKIGGAAGLCPSEHGQEFLVVSIVQLKVVTMRPGIGKDFPSRRIADLHVVLHNGIGLEVRLGRTAPLPNPFRERLSGGSKYLGQPKLHLAICSRILKSGRGRIEGTSCACFPCGKRRRSLSRDKSRGFILRLYRL